MTPALAVKDETIALALHLKGGREQVALAKSTTDLEFLADGEGFLRTYNLEFPDTSALASFEGNEVGDKAEIVLQLAIDEF